MTTPAVRLWYAIAVAFFACFLVAITSVLYANHVQRQSEQQWCELLTNLDQAYTETPPPTVSGRHIAAEIHRLRLKFDCPQ